MKIIITKYLEGHATDGEQAKLLAWLRDKDNRLAFNKQKFDWKKGFSKEFLSEGSELSWYAVQDQLLRDNYSGWRSSRKINQFFRIAAIFFFVVSLGSAVYFISNQPVIASEFFTSVVAENGQISKVLLPDGSTVWLNSGSEISYSNLFAAENRTIDLQGEAYFQVTRNEEMPLIVNSGELQVKVLGTKFNVAAYTESEIIKVVLESGSVELLNSNEEKFQYNLKSGELACFTKAGRKLTVHEVNTVKYTSWKDGMINIYNQPLEELLERLGKRYNQKFVYPEALKGYHFTFTIKNESLHEIIAVMEKIAPIKTKQKGDIIEFELDKKRQKAVDD